VSAIHDATGIWIKELPVTLEKIVMALKKKKRFYQGSTAQNKVHWCTSQCAHALLGLYL
jgi:hypothetical protein